VLIHVYGGPHAQVVRDHFRVPLQLWRNLLARRGILVFSMDGRGSWGRGREFEAPIHLRLTEVELEDQLEGVKYLRAQPFVDPGRLAIFGWSYGGTMVLSALLRTDGVFRAGVAVAPVTDWTQYDTAYTERYMQRPTDNLAGYEDTSLLPLAGELDAPLLLVHGQSDDNVHFANSALMIDAFVEAGKEIEVMLFPGKAHGIRGDKPRTWLFNKITRFLERHL
jgi:dipeptidyl-peptidase-4